MRLLPWLLLVPGIVSAQAAHPAIPSPEEQIETALLPLPEALRARAGVRGYATDLRPVTLRVSRNGLICTGDKPGDDEFDVRCYERALLKVIDRRRQLAGPGPFGVPHGPFDREINQGLLKVPTHPTAGYRMLGPIEAYNPKSRTFTSAIEKWQSVHFPFRTADQVALPVDREEVLPYVMASGTWWAHVMIQHGPPGPADDDRSPRLGSLHFANSGSAAAQDDFIRGVLYLHSFEYESAAAAFQAAERKDPEFVLAYWGEAMTHTHAIWNEQDLAAGQAVLAKLGPSREVRAAKPQTPREQAWLNAAEVLYGDGPKAQRDTLYSAAMDQLVDHYPDDEARAFQALAIMGLSQGVRDVPAYIRAGAIALDVFARQPNHPGAAHYVIHAFDDPAHAPLGLAAARAYSSIAPGAAHAQHMTTHIFLALGMWPDVIVQNRVAAGPDPSRWQPGHYTYWLHYGLLQSGQPDSAAALLDRLHAQLGTDQTPSRRTAHLAWARAQQIVSAERWSDPALAWDIGIPDDYPVAQAVDAFARGYAALRRGDTTQTRAALMALGRRRPGAGPEAVSDLLAAELRAAVLRAAGQTDSAYRLLTTVATAVASLPVEFGPPDFVKPPWELLGEWFLADGMRAEARDSFAKALRAMPGRALSQRGLGQVRETTR